MHHQKLGTAIGTKFGPPYANSFMTGLENEIFSDTNVQPLLWLQYLHDIFCIWTDGLEKLKEFFSYLNSCHPTIKFTMDYSDTTINFLDVSVTKNSTKLSTDLFTKDTDSHQYLHATSCHPYSCKKSIPYGQAIRIKRICSDPEQLKLRLEDLSNWLVNRGYKQEIVSQQIHRVDAIDRETLLIKHPKQNNIETLTLTLTYHPALKNVHEILRKAHRHTLKSPRLQYVLPTPLRVAFPNDKSLKDKLARSKLKNLNRRDPGRDLLSNVLHLTNWFVNIVSSPLKLVCGVSHF